MKKMIFTVPDDRFTWFVNSRISNQNPIYYSDKGLVQSGIPKKIGKSITGYTIILNNGTKISDSQILNVDQQIVEGNKMDSRKKKLLENFIRREVRKSLNENSTTLQQEIISRLRSMQKFLDSKLETDEIPDKEFYDLNTYISNWLIKFGPKFK